eukprot:CAMPEP_0202708554 /NCGR_PEP_ID=MMETSP1385-20130828/20734_1 /ASSEMBLY_ACC=CAM_ASM_000861 /TAXON_ID=933848 /ORGANISM="Elphidium margaritaceum" /LENGTH=179 /DNA_ID=CAMNT_0049367557 /DNA_START=81 /DNA_END=620 /DNA_ORIENTATION=+
MAEGTEKLIQASAPPDPVYTNQQPQMMGGQQPPPQGQPQAQYVYQATPNQVVYQPAQPQQVAYQPQPQQVVYQQPQQGYMPPQQAVVVLQPQQPQQQQQPPTRITGKDPQQIFCPRCQKVTTTTVSYVPGTATYLSCGGLFLVGCAFGCCLIPFCMDGLKDAEHRCGACQTFIDTKKVM